MKSENNESRSETSQRRKTNSYFFLEQNYLKLPVRVNVSH